MSSLIPISSGMASSMFRVFQRVAAVAARRIPPISSPISAKYATGMAAVVTAASCVALTHTTGDDRLIGMPSELRDTLCKTVKVYADFPKKGVMFEDVFPIFREPKLVTQMVQAMADFTTAKFGHVDVVVGLDSRGFLFGPILAGLLGCAFVPVRKGGKLPGEVKTVSYSKEYGVDVFEMQADSFQPGTRVLVVDDLLATGGTMQAAVDLLKGAGAQIVACYTIVELQALKGKQRVRAPCYTILLH